VKPAERKLAEIRATRDRARDQFEQRLGIARTELAPATVKSRLIADVKHKSLELATEAIEIANDSRGVVIGTAAALALWFARKPIGKAAMTLWQHPGRSETSAIWLDRIRKILNATPAAKTSEDNDRD